MKKLIILAVITALPLIYFIFFHQSPPKIDPSKITDSAIIDYPSKYNFRQTLNDCGPYNVAAVVRALKNEEVDSAKFAEEIEWRLPNDYTLPWGMEKQLKQNNISIEIPNLKSLSGEDKIAYLKEQLSQSHPIIILGEQGGYEHYVTLFGFNSTEDEFYVYNSIFEEGESGLTKDENNDLPGNKNFTSEELLNFWRKGGMYGLYEWYAIMNSY